MALPISLSKLSLVQCAGCTVDFAPQKQLAVASVRNSGWPPDTDYHIKFDVTVSLQTPTHPQPNRCPSSDPNKLSESPSFCSLFPVLDRLCPQTCQAWQTPTGCINNLHCKAPEALDCNAPVASDPTALGNLSTTKPLYFRAPHLPRRRSMLKSHRDEACWHAHIYSSFFVAGNALELQVGALHQRCHTSTAETHSFRSG